MTKSNAEIQYKIYNQRIMEERREIDKNLAAFELTLPIPLSYEHWRKLHILKGDYE